MNLLVGRHYVALSNRGLRRHLVMTTVRATDMRRGATLRYEVVSRHVTHRRAANRARVLNARNGRAH